jgi:hypothetical protein
MRNQETAVGERHHYVCETAVLICTLFKMEDNPYIKPPLHPPPPPQQCINEQ